MWRTVVIPKKAKLDLKLNYLTIRSDDTIQVHLSEINTLIIENTSVSITAALMVEMTKRKIKIVFCDEKRNPCFENAMYYGSHDTSLKIKNQISWDDYTKASVWTEIVKQKMQKQNEFLKELSIMDKADILDKHINQLQFNDSTNREGQCAKIYFTSLFGNKFCRDDDTTTNAALNYGYNILLSSFNRHITASGYITQIGIFHDNRYNMFNLSSDLMEPFRVLVIDAYIITTLINSNLMKNFA